MDKHWGSSGQSTLEYVLVLMAFLAMVVAFHALWEASHRGRLVEIARSSSGRNIDEGFSADLLRDLGAF